MSQWVTAESGWTLINLDQQSVVELVEIDYGDETRAEIEPECAIQAIDGTGESRNLKTGTQEECMKFLMLLRDKLSWVKGIGQ